MRVVFDTNVLISALIKKGKPKLLFDYATHGRIKPILSEPILEELIRVAKRQKLETYFKNDEVTEFVALLERIGEFVKVKSRVEVTRDKTDNAILATALDGNAEYVVSGDDDLLTVREWKGIRILTVEEMLNVLRRRKK